MSLSRGDICQICNRKFLYRDAMYELMGKLHVRDFDHKALQKELEREEYAYDQVVTSLSKAKQERRAHAKELQREKNTSLNRVTAHNLELQVIDSDVSMLVQKAGQAVVDKIDLEEEEKKLQEEIDTLEKKINDDSAMITSLEAEIQELEIENSD